MRVWIDQDYCTGSGLCELIEPRVFAIGGDGLARVHASEVPPECEDEVRDAAESCPGGCIRLEPRPLSRTYASFPPAHVKPADRVNDGIVVTVNETAPVLVLGPVLRYVGETAVSVWLETVQMTQPTASAAAPAISASAASVAVTVRPYRQCRGSSRKPRIACLTRV
jgi:ferredoxin